MNTHQTSHDREAQRFSKRNIFRSELIYGKGFNSSGGTAAIEMLCKDVPKFSGMSILDVGCGSGGAAFHFARNYEAKVVGVDCVAEMLALCRERHQEQSHLPIEFKQGDIQTLPLEANSFDLVWSRDVFMYLEDNGKAWRNIYNVLKPGGYFVYVDFFKGYRDISQKFVDYMNICNYYLQTLYECDRLLREVGYEVMRTVDITAWIADLYREDLVKLAQNEPYFVREYGQADYDHIVSRWHGKIEYGRQKDLLHGLAIARKPTG